MTRVTRYALFAVLAALVACPLPARADNTGLVPAHDAKGASNSAARIEEQIGAQVPLDVVFRDENDQPVTLKDCVGDKPTILVPVYYRCPMLCTQVLNGLLEAMRGMPADYSIGHQFNVVTISMDPKEHGDLARAKKAAYVGEYGRPGAEGGWRFLTGTKEASTTVLGAVGFRYEFDKMLKEFDHPSGVVLLSPQGKVTRYFYGINYAGEFKTEGAPVKAPDGRTTDPSTTLHLSLIEAADGKGGSLLTKLKMLCYRYESLHQGYSLNVLRVVQLGGVLTLLVLGGGLLLAFRRERLLGAVTARVALCFVLFGATIGAGALSMNTTGVYRMVIGATFLAVVLFATLVAVLVTRRRPAPTDTALPSGGTA